jgi:carbamate kinase
VREGLLVALGGHTLLRRGEAASVAAQRGNLRRSLDLLADMAGVGTRMAVVHGNGPQVGHALIRSEAAAGQSYDLPLDVCVAQTQGEIGYLIQETLGDLLRARGSDRRVVTVITRTVVHPSGLAAGAPRKPIGPFYSSPPASSFPVTQDAGRGYRRTVPSPVPLEVLEAPVIRDLFEDGVIVVAAGGGGIAVRRTEEGSLVGVEAVVDKDWAASLLALALGTDRVLDLTAVDCVKLGFGGPHQRDLRRLTPAEARRHFEAGEFRAGSMRPKIEAAVHFVESGGRDVIITSPEHAREAIAGRAGTRIVRADPGTA